MHLEAPGTGHVIAGGEPLLPFSLNSASACIQRWTLTLSAYDYAITYKPGKEHANADSLSRLPLPDSLREVPTPGEIVLMMETLEGSPVSAVHIKQWTDHDTLLSRVRDLVQHAWEDTSEEQLKPFNQRKLELSVQDDCVLWDSRVVVPQAGQAKVLKEPHDGHSGVSRIKCLARSVVWWPGIDHDVEEKVKACSQCQMNQSSPAKSTSASMGMAPTPLGTHSH